jgi:hypothetical protein
MPRNFDAVRWCNDSLHELLGFANDTLASYLVDVASQQSEADLLRVLREGGVERSPERLAEFCRELLIRTTRRKDGKEQIVGTSDKHRSNKRAKSTVASYDEETISTTARPASPTNKKPQAEASTDDKARRKRRYRREESGSSDDDDDNNGGLERYQRQMEERMESRRAKDEVSKLTVEERAELEREKDLR